MPSQGYLKNTTDDALPNYLLSLRFSQSHYYTDIRLILGYSAVAISAVTFYLDWTYGWDKTKGLTLWAVLAYFALNAAFTFWVWGVEKGVVFRGEREGRKLVVYTRTEKHKPTYYLTARFTASPTSTEYKELCIEAPFMRWFTSDGYFVSRPFQQWLASEIPLIGEADPNSVVEEIGRGSGAASASAVRSGVHAQGGILEQLNGSVGVGGAAKTKWKKR